MSDLRDELRTEINALGSTDDRVDVDIDHDPVNGRWLEKKFAEALERWGYHTARNKHLFGLETDVIGRRSRMRDDPDDFIVAECKDWHTTLVGREAVASISHRAFLARAMPVLVVSWGVTTPAWCLAQLLDVRIVTIDDLSKDSLPPLTEHRPPTGTYRTRREPCVSELRNRIPDLLKRPSELEIEAPVFFSGRQGPCYVPDRDGNDEYVNAYDADYNFG